MPTTLPAIGEEVTQALPPIGGEVVTPDFRTSNATDASGHNIVADTWKWANTPLVPQIADAAHAIADHLDMPKLDRGKTEAQIRGFFAGATGAAGDVAAGFTSPIGIAMTLASLGPESALVKAIPGASTLLNLPAVRALQTATKAVAGTGFTAHGVGQAVTAPTLGGKLTGVAEAATGAAVAAPAYAQIAGKVADAAEAWGATRRTAQGARAISELRQAIPPSKSTPYSDTELHRALPYLDVAHADTPVEGVDGLKKAADASIGAIEHHISSAIAAQPEARLDVQPVDAVRKALAGNPRANFVNKGLKAVLTDYPQLQGPLSLADADRIRKALNADMDALASKNNYELATAREADPTFAAQEAVSKLLRASVYQKLESLGVPDIADLRRDEGALMAVRNAAARQTFSADKPVAGTGTASVPRKIAAGVTRLAATAGGAAVAGPPGAVGGAVLGDTAANAILPSRMTRDALIAQAMARRLRSGTAATLTPMGTPDTGVVVAPPSTALTVPGETGMMR